MQIKNNLKIYCVLFIGFFLFNCSPQGTRVIAAKPQQKIKPHRNVDNAAKWIHISGNWTIDIKNKLVTENKGWARMAGYSEINNYNTLLSMKKVPQFNKFFAEFKIDEYKSPRKKTPSINLLFSFDGKNKMKNFRGIRLSGTDKVINRIELIQSTIKNPKLHKYKTWNYIITTLAEKNNISVKTNYFHKIKIYFKKNNIYCYLDGKKVLKHKTSPPLEGYMGISSRNCRSSFNKVLLKKNKDIVFHDDFSESKIMRYSGRYRRKK